MKKSLTNLTLVLIVIISAISFSSCSKQEKEKGKKVITANTANEKIVKATGYGESIEEALKDACGEAEFRAYGRVTEVDKKLQMIKNGKCKSNKILEQSKDEVGMWTVEIEAVVVKD